MMNFPNKAQKQLFTANDLEFSILAKPLREQLESKGFKLKGAKVDDFDKYREIMYKMQNDGILDNTIAKKITDKIVRALNKLIIE